MQHLQIGGMVYAFDLKSIFSIFSCLVIWGGAGVWFIGLALKASGGDEPSLGSNPSLPAIKTRTANMFL